MAEKQKVQESVIHSVLALYGLDTAFCEQREYITYNREHGDNLVKIILSVLLENGKRVVVKILHEQDDLLKDRAKIEKQSAFSEFMRQTGIRTPKRYMANGRYCNEYIYNDLPCNVTVEDWCGDEIMEINTDIAYKIGELMARMHILSLENKCEIGCNTLFSAVYRNDVDAFPDFCEIGKNENLDQTIIEQIKKLHDEKLDTIRAIWERLPMAAVQGDISINNLVYKEDELVVFDYNNAGDEVLISDLVLEGLLTAYEMDLPEGTDQSYRERLFPALLNGYLSIRKLNEEEANTAWIVYTLYHSLWFSKVVYNDDSLEKLVEKEDYAAANRLLKQMLADMTEADDGRFQK
ncbi:MAG: hypothetical protein IJW70_04220 [Clostridia bacterium]|nr:hypothetical protein [Clostridia bacterium]